jgi:hypothetical protein
MRPTQDTLEISRWTFFFMGQNECVEPLSRGFPVRAASAIDLKILYVVRCGPL